MPIVFFALLIGAVGALLGALLGVGGGIVMVPAFLKLGLEMKTAVATSLAVIFVTATVATARNASAGLVDWRIAGLAGLAAIVAAYFWHRSDATDPGGQLENRIWRLSHRRWHLHGGDA